jgi:hypothetical protein
MLSDGGRLLVPCLVLCLADIVQGGDLKQKQPTQLDLPSAERIVGEYQESLSKAKCEQETQRDKTLVLISGGVLTVSFAFIATFVEAPPSRSIVVS